ncbi:hypothetical protein ASPZODRAFT_145175 [Penicilliopsis zonata CBS 506.65]|uniref:Geranylgeranyl transferase type-2 subunit alpha n=1 Tax=Penicilliopsis zonata CBS 506.65 TaxID=1073090 RepID=A0A1L9SAC0_9EURO|nr:hypothetical protein ASPZODRAFT_145175 [Penicilliopsis zonata CBS 506.65]OJJ44049.1 hypothetical protein ASPZODRAFT_145175 [Penicilliopsis zonata CBS 506.65]
MSHGIPRYVQERTEEARQQQLRKIEKYQELDKLVHQKIAEHEYTTETLQNISELLTTNPEYYTVWNYRRQVLQHQFSLAASNDSNQIPTLIKNDLMFLIPLLRSFPKCYWIWNYRLWVLDEAKRLLPATVARKFWQEELVLVGKMLSLDSRNFHGWGYRRFVIQSLENLGADEDGKQSRAQEEFEYANKMIGTNLSNFSAWHYRTKLIKRLLDEKSAGDEERKKMLDDELKLIHRALCDPYDQSLWFYHQNLMCTFDTADSAQTMAPNLSTADRLEYLLVEIEEIEEMLDGAEDCKYIYQALINCTLLACKIRGTSSSQDRLNVTKWLSELKTIDPLRSKRWSDLEQRLKTELNDR